MSSVKPFCCGAMGATPVYFFEKNGEIRATAGGQSKAYRVALLPNCSRGQRVLVTDKEKIEWLAQNVFYRPYADADVISFKKIDPKSVSWKRKIVFTSTQKCAVAPCGSIVYWEGNDLIVKHWRSDQTKTLFTAEAKKPGISINREGHLILEDDKKQRTLINLKTFEHTKGFKPVSHPSLEAQYKALGYSNEQIEDVMQRFSEAINLEHIQLENWTDTVSDINKSLNYKRLLLVLSNGMIAIMKNRNGNNKLFLLFNPNASERGSFGATPISYPEKPEKEDSSGCVVKYQGTCATYEKKCWTSEVKELSHGMLAVATSPKGTYFALFRPAKNAKAANIHSSYKGAFICSFNNEIIEDFVELETGTLLIVSSENNSYKITALLPHVSEARADIGYKIDSLKFKIKHFPDRLDNYIKLAELYKKKSKRIKAINTYSCAITAAFRQGHLYFARRFFEKAYCLASYGTETMLIRHYKQLLPRQHSKEHRKLDLLLYRRNELSLDHFPIQKNCKTRLIVGDGDFSYTQALIAKHSDTHEKLPEAITATELRMPSGGEEKERIATLKFLGVTVLSGIDATKLDEHFKGQRFKRIHWNYPYAKALNDTAGHPAVIVAFFRSAAALQKNNDRVHVALFDYEREAMRNPILRASHTAGYRLLRKRSFNIESRYLGYQPVKSETGARLTGYQQGWEFVFEKYQPAKELQDLPISKKGNDLKGEDQKRFTIETVKFRENNAEDSEEMEEPYYVCSTDEESSDYYETDSDDETTSLKRKAEKELERKPKHPKDECEEIF